MNGNILVEARGLEKQFGHLKAVDGVSFTVNRGDIYGFLGPNGSGKSTTIRMMLGLIKPNGGEIKLFGQAMNRNNFRLLGKVGALIERPDFYNYLSAEKNLQLLARYSKLPKDDNRIPEVLDMVGLRDRASSKVRTFSQGMKQRLGIAQTLLHNPALIILDEPLNGLDPQGIKDVRDLLFKLNQEMGKTLIISSHILSEMELVANRMIVINRGKVVVEGEVKNLLKSSQVKIILLTNDTTKTIALLRKAYPQLNPEQNKLSEIIFETAFEDVPKINQLLVEAGVNVYQLNAVNSLEDYFLSITA